MEVTSKDEKDVYGRPKRIGSRLEIDKEQAKPSPGSTWNRKKRRCSGWARSGIWQMLRNPLYSGTYYWKKTQWIKPEGGRRVVQVRKEDEWLRRDVPELAIVKPAVWKLVQTRLSVNDGKPKDKRLQSGGKAVYMLSGMLRCGVCDSHFVMDSKTHYRCGKALDGKGCKNTIRVRRDVAEQVILRPVIKELLSPAFVDEIVKEMRACYEQCMAELRTKRDLMPAEVAELDKHIARLQERLKNGDPDLAADALVTIIERAEAKRAELMAAATPGDKRMGKVLHALPSAAAQYRQQISKGLQGNPDGGQPRPHGGAQATRPQHQAAARQGRRTSGCASGVSACGARYRSRRFGW